MRNTNNIENSGFHKLDLQTVDQIVSILKQKDTKRSRMLKLLFTAFVLAVVVYIISIIIMGYPNLSTIQILIANILMILIIIGSLVVYEKVVKASRIDYSLPVLEMLKKAEQKYKFIDNQWIIFVLLILLVNLAISIVFKLFIFPIKWSMIELTLVSMSVFIPLLVAVIVGVWYSWKKNQLPIKNKIKKMIDEMESAE